MIEDELKVYTAQALVSAIKNKKPEFDVPPTSPLTRGPSGTLIYFIQCRNAVKIGFSVNPWARVDLMASWNPYRLNIIGVLDGGQIEEARIHKALSLQAIHCEWFRMNDALEQIICIHTFEYLPQHVSPNADASRKKLSHTKTPHKTNLVSIFAAKSKASAGGDND